MSEQSNRPVLWNALLLFFRVIFIVTGDIYTPINVNSTAEYASNIENDTNLLIYLTYPLTLIRFKASSYVRDIFCYDELDA